MLYFNQALTAKRLGLVKNLTDFWKGAPQLTDSIPKVSEAITRKAFYQAAVRNRAMVEAYNLTDIP
jgi:hypothetical protein